MTDVNNRVFLPIAVLLAGFVAANAVAQPASAPPGKGPDKAPKAAERADAKAEKADAKAARAEAKAEKSEAKADTKAAEKIEKTGDKASKHEGEHGHEPGVGPDHGAHGHGPGGVRALGEDFRHGLLKKAELKERLAAMHETTGERRRAHQSELKHRWGAAALAHPSCREELRHHARREAFLNRAAFLAQTEITKDKDKLLERIEKLIAKEEERHARAMERLKSMPAAAGSVAPAAPSALPTPTASAGKAGEK